MLIQTLDHKEVNWKPSQANQNSRKTSKLQQRAEALILEILPGTILLREVVIPVKSGKRLYADLYLLKHNLIIEVQGIQHTKRVSMFHTKKGFKKQKENEELKAEWCELNGIRLVYLDHDNEEEWEGILREIIYGKY